MAEPISLPMSRALQPAACDIIPSTKHAQPTQENYPSASMIDATLSKKSGPGAEIFPIPEGKFKDLAPEALSKLLPASDFLTTGKSSTSLDNDDRDLALDQSKDIQHVALARQLSTSAVDLIVEQETEIDYRQGDRQVAIDLCKEACLVAYSDLSGAEFFNDGSISETSLSAMNAVLQTTSTFLHGDFGPAKTEAGMVAPHVAAAISWDARQLNQWSQENDIGIAILRMFVATWNQIRDTLRVERQMQIVEIRQLSEAAVAALIQQGKDKFAQDTLNAWATIASSIVQLVPLGVIKAYKRLFPKTKANVIDLTKNPMSKGERKKANIEVKTKDRNAKAQEMHNILTISGAFGQCIAGIINLYAADRGLDAANAYALFTKLSNLMQAANIDLENLNARGEAAWQNILQMLAVIAERQNQWNALNNRIAHV